MGPLGAQGRPKFPNGAPTTLLELILALLEPPGVHLCLLEEILGNIDILGLLESMLDLLASWKLILVPPGKLIEFLGYLII